MSDKLETPEDPKAPNPRGGPRTPEGKARSRFNAVRHGLTSQCSIFPWEEHAGYEQLFRRMSEHFKPVGPMEEFLVQSIVDGIWKLDRSKAMESGLFARYLRNQEGVLTEGEPQADLALIQGSMYSEEWRKLTTLWRHAQRVETQVHRSQKKLEELQEKRKRQEEEALLEAAALKVVHEKRPENKGIAYNPTEDGFVLTLEQLNTWIHRQERRQRAGLSFRKLPTTPEFPGKERIAA